MDRRTTIRAPRRRVRPRTFDWPRIGRVLLVLAAAGVLAATIVLLTRAGREGLSAAPAVPTRSLEGAARPLEPANTKVGSPLTERRP